MKENNKSKGCLIGCFSIIILAVILTFLLYACSGGNSDSTDLEEAQATYTEINDLYSNTEITPEEKITQAQELIDKTAPKLEELEKAKDDELPKMGRTFQTWQAYLSMNGALNAIVQNDPEYYQKCMDAAQESLNRAENETD